MKDSIFVRDLALEAIIGIHPRERTTPQRLLISFELETDIHAAAASDAIDNAIDYDAASAAIAQLVENNPFYLIETLAERVATLLLEEFGADAVSIEVQKPDAVGAAGSVGVRIRRTAA